MTDALSSRTSLLCSQERCCFGKVQSPVAICIGYLLRLLQGPYKIICVLSSQSIYLALGTQRVKIARELLSP